MPFRPISGKHLNKQWPSEPFFYPCFQTVSIEYFVLFSHGKLGAGEVARNFQLLCSLKEWQYLNRSSISDDTYK